MFYVGGGVIKAHASQELRELAELVGAPVATTLMARGVFPDSHPQHVGMPGMHGSVSAVTALQQADLLITLGARFDDRVTGVLSTFAPGAKVIHADIDPAEISKNRTADMPIVGSVKEIIPELAEACRERFAAEGAPRPGRLVGHAGPAPRDLPAGLHRTRRRTGGPAAGDPANRRTDRPGGRLRRRRGPAPDVGAQFIKYERPHAWLNSGGLGTMGYSVPAAMGAKVGNPDRVVWAIDGDGCFQMTNQELATCRLNNIPIKVAVINNSSLGMVRQWQTLFYDGRYSNTDLNTGHDTVRVPDFVKMADAYDCVGLRCDRVEDIDATIQQALAINDRPVVIDFVVSPNAMVWPMVPSGVSNDLIQIARDMTPVWEEED